MIRIQKNQLNKCIFTLEEKRTIADADYILELKIGNRSIKSLPLPSSANTTTNVVRYDAFNITEVPLSGESLDDRFINLESGDYDYYVWQASGGTTALSAATSIVESGKLSVIGEKSPNNVLNTQKNIITFR